MVYIQETFRKPQVWLFLPILWWVWQGLGMVLLSPNGVVSGFSRIWLAPILRLDTALDGVQKAVILRKKWQRRSNLLLAHHCSFLKEQAACVFDSLLICLLCLFV